MTVRNDGGDGVGVSTQCLLQSKSCVQVVSGSDMFVRARCLAKTRATVVLVVGVVVVASRVHTDERLI